MSVIHNKTFSIIAEGIQQALKAMGHADILTLESIANSLTEPPDKKMGHLAFPCFPLAKALKSAPPKISAELLSHLPQNPLVTKATPVGPYLNFFLDLQTLGKIEIEEILNGNYFKRKLIAGNQKTMVEYSQPNTHKELHVGHMRNLCLGNAVVRIARYAGVETTAVTYPGDVGTHVAKCLWYYKNHYKGQIPTENKGAWLGTLYSKAHIMLEDQIGTDKEDSNRQQLTAILKQLEQKSGEYYDLWKETREWSIALMKSAYDWADVQFDRWFWESEMDSPSLEYAQELLAQGKLVKDQGAVGMDLSDDGLGFCLLIKTDGTGLYATKDVLLAKRKFEEFGVDRSVYVVDNRQAHHFRQVFKVLEKLGFEKASQCSHLQYDVVELPDGAMSSRKGNIVPLMDLIHQMEDSIKNNYLNKYLSSEENKWSQAEVDETAKMIANGAIKFGMIRIDNNRKIVFDMNEWLKLDGETGPYLQYVHARISTMCKKQGFDQKQTVQWSSLKEGPENALMTKLYLFNNIVTSCAEQWKTIHLCSYLYDLGKLYNHFYAECSISKAETEELKTARLALSYATGEVIKKGLEILGIKSPQKM
ncbi:MAG: arginine--tRNA ligase [Bdellovibrio sp. CG12_big_fil_rev_8_21_14_0_65_39_13]|nr:MAG: arginine--tRNA ligase [Bdellovibrio sp. CG22_combo_CG10-13_8_21_14_all_39_27]PIQ61471.1 MAG: arginine--tRNA ligase [Bdellovibrio sp. CG12_big_fil_rev_8_21_14_0_65_39_13]PIR35317.1 MAG: arginine--tRNA ligase [Bdellovibrio sp. CG11_big_fil_rev_8_21_14_0_20_39_38]